jgi:hypothetical protein
MLDSAGEFGDVVGDVDMDPTEQWREGVQEADFPDEEAVLAFSLPASAFH